MASTICAVCAITVGRRIRDCWEGVRSILRFHYQSDVLLGVSRTRKKRTRDYGVPVAGGKQMFSYLYMSRHRHGRSETVSGSRDRYTPHFVTCIRPSKHRVRLRTSALLACKSCCFRETSPRTHRGCGWTQGVHVLFNRYAQWRIVTLPTLLESHRLMCILEDRKDNKAQMFPAV